jgi:hypothetical protein
MAAYDGFRADDDTLDLPDLDGLLAGTVALMTAWASPCPHAKLPADELRALLARKVVSNLFFLQHHPGVSPPLARSLLAARAQWRTLGEAAADVEGAVSRAPTSAMTRTAAPASASASASAPARVPPQPAAALRRAQPAGQPPFLGLVAQGPVGPDAGPCGCDARPAAASSTPMSERAPVNAPVTVPVTGPVHGPAQASPNVPRKASATHPATPSALVAGTRTLH